VSTEKPRVLYVEDDPKSCEIMDVMLGKFLGLSDYVIMEGSFDFLDRLAALPKAPDIFLVDIFMEPNNGYDILHMIRQHDDHRFTPVIALTASVTAQEVDYMKESGFDGLIGKPLSTQTFPNLFQRVLAGEKIWKGS
jgi:two-component system cell cycle response regulator DivK